MRATDLEIRRAMRAIARDELRHAALSWDVADWLASRLTPQERARADEERTRAIEELEHELTDDPSEKCRAELGLPRRAEAQRILREMQGKIWPRGAKAAA